MKFVDLGRQYEAYRGEIDQAIADVIGKTSFINGPSVQSFEQELSDYVGGAHAIGCSSGTDALTLAMMGLGVKPGDEVIVPDFTFFATAETVSLLGAIPVFSDIDPVTYTMRPEDIEHLVTNRTVGVIPVSLYGQCADMDSLMAFANEKGLWVIEDGAQSFGADYNGRKSCGLGTTATTSFFPAKPLGAYGDGGAIFTDNGELAEKLRLLLNHGQSRTYEHAIVGMNGRLDAMQAAVLSVKLRHLDEELELRQRNADVYDSLLGGSVTTPRIAEGNRSAWAQYTIRTRDRSGLASFLREHDVPTAVHYPIPLSRQQAFANGEARPENPAALRASQEVLSLPIHPFLEQSELEMIAGLVLEYTERAGGN